MKGKNKANLMLLTVCFLFEYPGRVDFQNIFTIYVGCNLTVNSKVAQTKKTKQACYLSKKRTIF